MGTTHLHISKHTYEYRRNLQSLQPQLVKYEHVGPHFPVGVFA